MMPLNPKDTTQKILISTTAHMYGHYEHDGIMLTLAWPPDRYQGERMLGRSACILAFETEPIERLPGTVTPHYSFVGETICAYLSLLFGKRFDSHGSLENCGSYYVPDMRVFERPFLKQMPQNSDDIRKDAPVPLNLTEFKRIEHTVLSHQMDEKGRRTFDSATKFYYQALQTVEDDPEVAYLHLITAGEILAGFYEHDQEALLPRDFKIKLDEIGAIEPNGAKLRKWALSNLFFVKRKFTSTILRLIDDDFFDRFETQDKDWAVQKKTFKKTIQAAYDLRSRYVHTGTPFGGVVFLGAGGLNPEIQLGKHKIADRELAKLWHQAPTYCGLERVIRFCILRFAEENGLYAAVQPETP